MIYRFWQLVRALSSRITAQEQQFVANVLSAGELDLFRRMARFDQRHCLDVAQTLERGGQLDSVLLKAALLHDVGKVADDGRPIPLLYYGLFVVLKKVAPSLYDRIAANGRGALWPFAIHKTHEQRSAALVLAAGGTPAVVVILQDYAADHETAATRLLAWADDLN